MCRDTSPRQGVLLLLHQTLKNLPYMAVCVRGIPLDSNRLPPPVIGVFGERVVNVKPGKPVP